MAHSIYLAEIVTPPSTENLRMRVRILPHMRAIEEVDLLPIYPYFFSNQAFLAVEGERVWVLSSHDFDYGYVLGPASKNTVLGDFADQSIDEELRTALENSLIELRGEVFSFTNTIVSYWDENSIHFVNRATGASTIAYRSGTLHRVQGDRIILKVGSSSLTIEDGAVRFDAQRIYLGGQVSLGTNPIGPVLVGAGRNGEVSIASESVEA